MYRWEWILRWWVWHHNLRWLEWTWRQECLKAWWHQWECNRFDLEIWHKLICICRTSRKRCLSKLEWFVLFMWYCMFLYIRAQNLSPELFVELFKCYLWSCLNGQMEIRIFSLLSVKWKLCHYIFWFWFSANDDAVRNASKHGICS